MAVRPVLTYPHPLLKQPAEPVRDPVQALGLATDLVDTMADFGHCVGLAAPQIGVPLRMVAVDVSAHPKADASHGLLVLMNPQIVEEAGSELGREGCLSLPEITANVVRAKRIRFSAFSPEGDFVESVSAGFEARAILHEIDHLDGILILDRVASAAEIFQRKRK